MSEEIQTHIVARFEVHRKIGSGAYGHVWKVTDKKSKKIKALKKNFDAFNNSTDAQRTYRQIMFLMEVSHPNIIKLEEVIRAENHRDIYLIFEHMDIDLYTVIKQNILAQRHRKYIFYQMCKALHYLHSAGLIHRDVKPSNVLLNENCDAKLCDFGLVRSLEDHPPTSEGSDILTEYIATRWYRAPEILLGSRKYHRAIDIWSMGCLLAEMQKGKPLFPGTSTMNQLEKVVMWTGPPTDAQIESLQLTSGAEVFKMMGRSKKVNRKEVVPAASDLCLDLISRMLEFNPDRRPNIQEIMKHPYLKEFFHREDLIVSERQVRVPIDDNQRLSLKEYRNLIYDQLRRKSKSTIDVHNNSTLYRINKTVRKSQPKKEQEQPFDPRSTHYHHDEQIRKKSFYKHNPIVLGKGRNVKTIEKEWNPVQAKKSTLVKDVDKHGQSKYEVEWVRKKRSTTQANHHPKKYARNLPSPAELRHRFL